MSSETSAARVEGDRILSIDVVRGMAVLGILLMNIVAMGLPILTAVFGLLVVVAWWYFPPRRHKPATGADRRQSGGR